MSSDSSLGSGAASAGSGDEDAALASKRASRYVLSYRECLAGLRATHGDDIALELIVGGQYERVGVLERNLLLTLGLQTHERIVDIGCGTGRLATQLRAHHEGQYIGTDILVDLVDEARRKASRPDWEFWLVGGSSSAGTWGVLGHNLWLVARLLVDQRKIAEAA